MSRHDDGERGKVYTVGESQPWMTDFWKRLAEHDTEADFDETGKRVIKGETDAEFFERQQP